MAYLYLENGVVFEGEFFGAEGSAAGEVVFSTNMTGYNETLTDKSFYGQILLQTFPLTGGCGVIPEDFESDSPSVAAYIVKNPCDKPSNFRSEGSLGGFLKSRGVVGLCGIDTRALVETLRENGTMNGGISAVKPTRNDIEKLKHHRIENAVSSVAVKETVTYNAETPEYNAALMDLGANNSLIRALTARGVQLTADNELLSKLRKSPAPSFEKEGGGTRFDGVVLSGGPGDPAASENAGIIETLKAVIAAGIPIFAVGLGHQLLALAHGFGTYKMKLGHRGSNIPVKDLTDGRVYITRENHGYAVSRDSVDPDTASEWFVNINDKTCEGLIYKNISAFSVQFYPVGDTAFVIDRFISAMGGGR